MTRWLKQRCRMAQWLRRNLVADSTIKVFLVGMGLAALFVLASMLVIRNHESKRLMGQLDELLTTVESAVSVACFVGDATLAGDVARGLLTNRMVAGVKIVANRRILANEYRMGDFPLPIVDSYVVHRAVVSPFSAAEAVGDVELVADTGFIAAQAADYSIMSAAVLMLEVLVIVWVVAVAMRSKVVAPIRILSERTRAVRIDAGQYVVAPEGHGRNEIGRLAADFNHLIDNMNTLLVAEQTLREDIADSERRFRTLAENSPDIIVRYDSDCRRIFANPAYARETGIPLERALNSTVDDLSLWRPTMPANEFRQRLRRVMNSGQPEQILLEWRHDDGHWVCHEMYVVAEYDIVGRPAGALAIGRNVTERMHAERQLVHLASYDALTGLLNRRLFADRLRQEIVKARRGAYCIALLFIDLDRFKEINDTQGHGVGDQVLVVASQRICGRVRESDTVARLAGDEFVVILPDTGDNEPLGRVAQGIISDLADPFQIGEHGTYLSASIGIAVFPRDADNDETLVACADQALHAAKLAGGNNFSFFSPGMLEQTQQRLQLAGDLREALDKGQLEVHYQPIVEIASGETVKAEALLRWHHPQRGLVSPDQFIPIAEETGLIQEIGAWVFREAVDVAKRWNVRSNRPRKISVNMSPRQFTRGCCDQQVIAYLQDYGLEPGRIVMEITEGLLLEDRPNITGTLQRLRTAGIEIALDDFGTGYSAMAYLKKFNIDYLKIDRSFVRDLETDHGDRAIAEAIVVMAHRLGLKVIAEGVETVGQAELLGAVGCEYVQGYLYARPMPVEAFLAHVGQDGGMH